MAHNSFGDIFRITTWGESHGKAIGVVIDGCPAGLELSVEDIQAELDKRAPGNSPLTSPRKESDAAEILSGLFEGKTTGAPISILIPNKDADSSKYEPIKNLMRPGHANFTYIQKYGVFDYRGGGRASARETACRVAAGAVAKKLLEHEGISVASYIKEIAGITADVSTHPEDIYDSPVYCPDKVASKQMVACIEKVKAEGDSVGGVVEAIATGLPAGLGDPVYGKLEAKLGQAMLSIPASKAIEIGSGFNAATMRGSEHNDSFHEVDGKIVTDTNHAGGVLGGISTGMPLVVRTTFKPPSSIPKPQNTVDADGKPQTFKLPEGSRHDPCVAIRAVPVVEAMLALTLADTLLLAKTSHL